MGQALSGRLQAYWKNDSSEEEEARARLAPVPLGMHSNPSEAAASYGRHEMAMYSPSPFANLSLAAAPPNSITTSRSSGGRGRNGGGGGIPRLLSWSTTTVAWMSDYDLEAGGQAHWVGTRGTGGGDAAPVQEPSEVAKMLEGFVVQAYAALLPSCVTAYSVLKDAPRYIKFTVFLGLAITTVVFFVGLLSRSVRRRRKLAVRLVSCAAITVLTITVATQLSSRTYTALTALIGGAVNLIIMLLPSSA